MKIKFTQVKEFAKELEEHGPDIEQVVRLCRLYTQSQYPFQTVSILATYARSFGDNTIVVELRTPPYGDLWGQGFEEQDEKVHAAVEKAMAFIKGVAERQDCAVRSGYYDED
jgi:hypothetical protein